MYSLFGLTNDNEYPSFYRPADGQVQVQVQGAGAGTGAGTPFATYYDIDDKSSYE